MQHNSTASNLENIPLDSNFAWLLCALFLAMGWVIYITYYNSRVMGYILTKVLNRFIKEGRLKLGSISISVLSGKMMFRDINFITRDFSVRIQDGWIIFRWWRPYIQRELSEDMSHLDTRLSILLNGFEFHIYNRTALYAKLEHIFNQGPNGENKVTEAGLQKEDSSNDEGFKVLEQEQEFKRPHEQWRDLFPVIKLDVTTGRFVFGNRLLPTTLSVAFDDVHIVYTTKPASTKVDYFMHSAKCKAENLKVMMAPSPRYVDVADEPPRFMGEGFVILQSNNVDLYYYMDEPGLVPEEPEVTVLANGDVVETPTCPCWGIDIKCGKGTDLSYGPWADRQREHLFKFFFPADYQTMLVTKLPQPGELRQVQSFDIRLSTLADATIDILFSKRKETNAIHMNVGPGSYLEVTIPWLITESGYTTRINGQLLHLDTSTSLQYRSFVETETLEFDVKVTYPLIWNHCQHWSCEMTGCKASVCFIFAHKWFFQDMIEDWASKTIPDLCHFVPYTWHFNLILKEFELLTLANQYNWIDCSSQHQENAHVAFSGELFDLSFDLPFTDFMPPTVPIKFWIQGESVDVRLFVPESVTSRHSLLALDKNSKITDRDGTIKQKVENEKKWRNLTQKSLGWIDCWSVPIVALSVGYTYHPIHPLLKSKSDIQISTPEREEILLAPLKPERKNMPPLRKIIHKPPPDFDPVTLESDLINLELEVGSSVLCLYGALLKHFMAVKENYFGEDQAFTDFEVVNQGCNTSKENESFDDWDFDQAKEFDPRNYRPLEVTVLVTIHDVQVHLMKHCTNDDSPCPCIHVERLGFEMHKIYRETKLQLLLSPVYLISVDTVQRSENECHLKDGHLALTGLQVRGHAMFSSEGLALDSETLEYAWLLEIQVGDITGRLTAPQLSNIFTALETFIMLVTDPENNLQHPVTYRTCQHRYPQPQCMESLVDLPCPTSDDIKYRMTRLSVDSVDIYLVEVGTAFNLQVYPIRIANCNLHSKKTQAGLTALIQHVHLKQYVQNNYSITSNQGNHSDIWLEAGSIAFGPVNVDSALAPTHPRLCEIQSRFLKFHDLKSKRLWFLWPSDLNLVSSGVISKCGCLGGCKFFGNNRNGVRFFQPNRFDAHEGVNTALFRIYPEGTDPGYGQSLLQKGQLVFNIPSAPVSPSRPRSINFTTGYMGRPSPLTPMTVTTVVDEFSQRDSIKTSDEQSQSVTSIPSSRNKKVYRQDSIDMGMSVKSDILTNNQALDFNGFFNDTDSSISQASVIDTLAGGPASDTSSAVFSSPSIASFIELQNKRSESQNENKPLIKSAIIPRQTSHGSIAASGMFSFGHHGSKSSLNSQGYVGSNIMKSNSRQSLLSSRQPSLSQSPRMGRRATSSDSYQSMSEVFYSAEEEMSDYLGHVMPSQGSLDGEFLRMPTFYVEPDGTLSQIVDSTLQQTVIEGHLSPNECSTSDSVSSTSFISALSSQEDLAMVDLHAQLNKPITQSPLLMSCYMSNMTQYHCNHWQEPAPFPHVISRSGSVAFHNQNHVFNSRHSECSIHDPNPNFLPQYTQTISGISVSHMVTKARNKNLPTPGGHINLEAWEDSDDAQKLKEDKEITITYGFNQMKTTAIVKVDGSVDILFSPLMLESLEKYIEAVTPTVGRQHPLTIIDDLHRNCSEIVKSHNKLKQDKYSQQQPAIDLSKKRESLRNNKIVPDSFCQESLNQITQVFLKLPKLNICFLQASIVEEVISFSALENAKDLTCVSLLAICLTSISCQFRHSSQTHKVIQAYSDDSPEPVVKPPTGLLRKASSKRKPELVVKEPKTIESNEMLREEMVGSMSISKVHTQLRRMKNQSNILKDAILTVIPINKSKVSFTFDKEAVSACEAEGLPNYSHTFKDTAASDTDDRRLGFIMFECGFEDITVKMVKRNGFEAFHEGTKCNPVNKPVEPTTERLDPCDIRSKVSKGLRKDSQTVHHSNESLNSKVSGTSWQTMLSLKLDDSENGSNRSPATLNANSLTGDAAACILELKTVWFNFAAPPRMPNTRKIDFTRLDWHLLSTASPGINAWLNPSYRLTIAIKKLKKEGSLRLCAVMACMMTEALDVQGIHMPYRVGSQNKSKYSKLTLLARTLQEDPSCQLFTVLRRYISQNELQKIEENVNVDTLPQLSTLKKGLVALARQWKNVLYMPLLVEHNFKSRKSLRPFTVTFAMPLVESNDNVCDDADGSVEDFDITDDRTSLLKTRNESVVNFPREGQSQASQGSMHNMFTGSSGESHNLVDGITISSSTLQSGKAKVSYLPSFKQRTSRASIAFPIGSQQYMFDSPGQLTTSTSSTPRTHQVLGLPMHYFGLKRNESDNSLLSQTVSISSCDANVNNYSPQGTPHRHFNPKAFPNFEEQDGEDLYKWMVRQQDYMKIGQDNKMPGLVESTSDALNKKQSIEQEPALLENMPTVTLAPPAVQLADAQVIFQPLLSCLGIVVDSRLAMIGKALGTNVSVSGMLECFKIDIVESEEQVKRKKKTGSAKASSKPKQYGKFYIDTTLETPALLCDGLRVNLEIASVKDFEKTKNENTLLTGDILQQAVFADNSQKQLTTLVNFDINLKYIAQQVNMPLLRLLHQFSTMIENIKETRTELRENRPGSIRHRKTHKKEDSSSTTQTELESTKLSPSEVEIITTTISRPAGKIDNLKLENLERPTKSTKFTKVTSLPQSLNLSESIAMDIMDTSSPPISEKTIADQIKENTPHCWRTMYYLLDLYASMTETKTVTSISPVPQDSNRPEDAEGYKSTGKYEPLKEHRIDIENDDGAKKTLLEHDTHVKRPSIQRGRIRTLNPGYLLIERIPLVVFGVVNVKKTRLLALLSGLKLESELTGIHTSFTHKEKLAVSGTISRRRSQESSVTGHIGQTVIVLLEGDSPNLQTVVKVNVAKTQGLYSMATKRNKEKSSVLISIGAITVDIPHHPVVLHGMMTRGTKQLSSTLLEFRRNPSRTRTNEEVDGLPARSPKYEDLTTSRDKLPAKHLPVKSIVVHFSIVLDSLAVEASLLPSLRAQYKMGQVVSIGVTGNKAKFTVDLPTHSLSFESKIQTLEANLPSSASIDMPPVLLSAEYIQDTSGTPKYDNTQFSEGVVLREGNYLNAVAEIGSFEHSLTTDLLNHLVFVQKVFMKEVNEVVQKVSGGDKPVPLWGDDDKPSVILAKPTRMLYSLQLRLKGIQITATTPTSSAVRLETGAVELQLSNRVQNMCRKVGANRNVSTKVFGKAQVDLNLSLGQLLKNALFEEAEPEFQQFAFFKTRISLRNALQDEMISSDLEDKEAVLITLNRPIMYVMPIALDKAVLVWLNYKNAYEYWNEQRLALNKEVQRATQQVFERLPSISQTNTQSLGTLFLQLTVDDLGICLPLNPISQGYTPSTRMIDNEPGPALVMTLERTRISACSRGSLVSKGRFTGFCLRFSDDFEISWDDWKPDDVNGNNMNVCVVPEGTYEVCSRTIGQQVSDPGSNAKWILNVQWQMEGIDLHVDTNIGKQLSALINTLTALASDEEDVVDFDGDPTYHQNINHQEPVPLRRGFSNAENYLYDGTLDPKRRSRLMEKEMNEQARIVNDLKLLGASHGTIEQETRRLKELEAAVFNDFRRDVIKRLRRQSVKATSLKDKLGLGYKSSHHRSKSIAVPSTGLTQGKKAKLSPLENLSPVFPDNDVIQGVYSRASSIDISPGEGTKVTFDTHVIHRDLSLNDILTATNSSPSPPENSSPTKSFSSYDHSSTTPESTPSDIVDIEQDYLKKAAETTPKPPAKLYGDGRSHSMTYCQTSNLSITSTGKTSALMPPEPNIDFELDVKVLIDSGKCVFHTKDPKDEELKKSMRKERSFSGGQSDLPPSPGRKRGLKQQPSVGSHLGGKVKTPLLQPFQTDATIFLLPGLDVKVHYNSKTIPSESPSTSANNTMRSSLEASDLSRAGSLEPFPTLQQTRKTGNKKASLYAWMTLQSLPEETLISPHLLDFLEQALEPIPIQPSSSQSKQSTASHANDTLDNVFNLDLENTGAAALAASTNYVYASFPVDVVVYFRVQPSILRFSCLPISRVECILRLPSLDLIISSKRADNELPGDSSTPPLKTKVYTSRPNSATSNRDRYRTSSGSRRVMGHSSESLNSPTQGGGTSVTGCLADFSLYIFHPYGGGAQKKTGLSSSNLSKVDLGVSGSIRENTLFIDNERKDSLSLQVEFVKVNISRSKANIQSDSNMQNQPAFKASRSIDNSNANVIRFSAVCDIGSASFKYDMRRLSEILAFPKAWYRRSIARRMFLGDQSSSAIYSDKDISDEDSSSSCTSPTSLAPDSAAAKGNILTFVRSMSRISESSETSHLSFNRRSFSHRNKEKVQVNGVETNSSFVYPASAPHSPVTDSRNHVPYALPSTSAILGMHNLSQQTSTPMHSAKNQSSNWETLVLFAVNLSRLDVHMNMGNVMGNTTWLTTDFKSQGRLSIGSSGHKNMYMSIGLGGSSLDAKSGIVGGIIELSKIETFVHIREDPGQDPDHTIGCMLTALEARLDYMGTSVLMVRVSSLDVSVKDEWRINVEQLSDKPLATTRPALIFIHGDLCWDQFQIIISKSTTPDLIKMYSKLEEFFNQQFKSSKRVFSSLQPRSQPSLRIRTPKRKISEVSTMDQMSRHHRHWQKVLRRVSGLYLPTLLYPLPKNGTILGGTVALHGNNISLACFHGINFKAKSWALFSLREPHISFATEAQDIVNPDAIDTHIVQNLSFRLGHNLTEHNENTSMATVSRMIRNHYVPPQFRTMQEWFIYAFANSEIDEVDRFPTLDRDRSDSISSDRRPSRKGDDTAHTTDVIFSFPSLQLQLKSEHLQAQNEPGPIDAKPVVDCSFVTEFDDHIFVGVDAENFFFLHDLVTSYIKEKDKGNAKLVSSGNNISATVPPSVSPSEQENGEPSLDSEKKKKLTDPMEILQKDWRDFQCHTWHLEPTVRLLSWAGKRIEPYGVDKILQKLGFSHARVTIPKWIQRGTLDPLDKILSLLMDKLILAATEGKQPPSSPTFPHSPHSP